jgi:hypothetical protein
MSIAQQSMYSCAEAMQCVTGTAAERRGSDQKTREGPVVGPLVTRSH